MTDEQHEGGTEWEAAQALKAIRAARVAGDFDAEQHGWLRYTEAVTNASYSGAAAAFIGILGQRESESLARMNELSQARQREAHEILTILKGLQGGQTALQAGFQAVAESVNQMQGEIKELAEGLERSAAHRAALQQGQDVLQRGQDELRARMLPEAERDRLIAEHRAVIARLDALEDWRSVIERRLGEPSEAP